MENISRTKNTKRNLYVGLIAKILLLVFAFISRTIFIRVLGEDYTGVNSLYSSILGFLSLADLGLGSVIIYQLYKPLKDKDEEALRSLIKLSQGIYRKISLAILIIGLLFIPFLRYIVNSSLDDFHLLIYYLLYLLNSLSSYLVVYRTSIINADQKNYISQLVDVIGQFLMYVVQTTYIIIYKDFLGYLIIQVIFTILKNITLNIIAKKLYPYLDNDSLKKAKDIDAGNIYKSVKSTFISKLSNTIINQTDSIIISILFGTIYVGYYNNYYMLVTYVGSVFYILTSALEASVGNLNAEGDKDKSYQIYRILSFIVYVLTITFVAEYISIIQEFVVLWIGEAHLVTFDLVIAIMFTFYFQENMAILSIFRQTLGLFNEVRYIYLIMAILNIVLSIILGNIMGISGVIYATGISRLFTVFWFEGFLVFNKLGRRKRDFLYEHVKYLISTVLIVLVCYKLSSLYTAYTLPTLILKALILLIVIVIMLLVMYFKTQAFKQTIDYLKQVTILSRLSKKGK